MELARSTWKSSGAAWVRRRRPRRPDGRVDVELSRCGAGLEHRRPGVSIPPPRSPAEAVTPSGDRAVRFE